MKEAGTPLSEIKDYIERQDTARFLALLTEKRRMLETEQRKIARMLRLMQYMIDQTERAVRAEYKMPRLKTQQSEYLATVRLIDLDDERENVVRTNELYRHCLDGDLIESMAAGFIVGRSHAETEVLGKPDYFFFRIRDGADCPGLHIKPKGLYAVIDHKGSYESLGDAFETLKEFIAYSGRTITGDVYVYELLGYMAAGNPDNYVIEIAAPVD